MADLPKPTVNGQYWDTESLAVWLCKTLRREDDGQAADITPRTITSLRSMHKIPQGRWLSSVYWTEEEALAIREAFLSMPKGPKWTGKLVPVSAEAR